MPDIHDSDSVQGRWTHYGSIGHSYDWPSPSSGIARPEGIVASGVGMPAILHAGRWKMTATIQAVQRAAARRSFPLLGGTPVERLRGGWRQIGRKGILPAQVAAAWTVEK